MFFPIFAFPGPLADPSTLNLKPGNFRRAFADRAAHAGESLSKHRAPRSGPITHPALALGRDEIKANLGYMFINGRGVQTDREAGLHWLLQAANQGFDYAQYSVGVLYEKGTQVAQDFGEADGWYRLTAEQGYADAQCNLGNLYFTGRGVEVDNNEALHWFELAAQKGHPQAVSGAMYLQAHMS